MRRLTLALLAGEIEIVDAGTLLREPRGEIELPEKDSPLVASALWAEATQLITGELRDFGPYLSVETLGIRVLSWRLPQSLRRPIPELQGRKHPHWGHLALKLVKDTPVLHASLQAAALPR